MPSLTSLAAGIGDPHSHPMYPDLHGKTAVVTGATSDIGLAICLHLAAQGARVALSGRDRQRLADAHAAVFQISQSAVAYPADCTDFRELEALREKVESSLGPADLLVATAGGSRERMPTIPAERMAPELWSSVVDGILTSVFLTLKCFLPGMKARHRGAIVTMASSAGRAPSRASAAYGAAKAGVIMLSRYIAKEAAPDGVRVNSIAPAAILIERLKQNLPEPGLSQLAKQFPLQRLGTPGDVAAAILFLLSDASSWMTGVTLDLDGGQLNK
jgi:3-oxoacyl-[acyl-carrier protein] reductase